MKPDLDDKGALTIRQFCQSHSLSEHSYFKLQREGRGPRVFRIGRKVLISKEDAAEWRRQRVEETKT